MPAPYINTPRTVDGTYLSNDGLDGVSPEKSFAVPNENGDLIAQMKRARANGANLKTPRIGGREPFGVIANGNQPRAKAEFTPLMKSVTKTNMARRLSAKRLSGGATPAHLRNSYIGNGTPALPRMDDSNMHSELTGSSLGRNDDTPMLQNISSSAQSTPLAQLPGRDAVVNDGNMMTLREQENIIDKIEKENFGLKMKIHFLEEAIAKRGGEFNQAALKENTDLKVNRITMQRELHKFKKTLAQAERDAEIYRQQLEEYRERVRRKQIDESVRIEMETVREELRMKDTEIEELRAKYESVRGRNSSEIDKLRDEIGDLQAELREKDRHLEERDEEIDSLRTDTKKESSVAAELEDELESARQKIEDLQNDLDTASRQAQEAKEECDEAMIEKRRAEADLDELRDEMANKSFSTKGLSRQLEEKADRLEEENQELQEKQSTLQDKVDTMTQAEKELKERLRDLERGATNDARHVQQELENVQEMYDASERKIVAMQRQIEALERDLRIKGDEKDLLQVRHDALTTESAELQKEVEQLQRYVQDLKADLEHERQQSAHLDNSLRTQHKNEVDILNDQIDTLHREVNEKETNHAADLEDWQSQKRELETVSRKAEEKANGLQRTVDKLNDVQGALSGKESRLSEALESEKQRYVEEEKVLRKQIQELHDDLAAKRAAADNNRSELNNAREELRISIREQAALKEKVGELEDEIEVLQADIEQEHEFVQQLQQKSTSAADVQLTKLHKEKKDLQESLASINAELHVAKRAAETLEAEKEQLEDRLEEVQQQKDDTFDAQQEKRELRKAKQRLENEIESLKSERNALSTANQVLEQEINVEIERANAEENRLQTEIDQLKNKQISGIDTKERELMLTKSKVVRLESRIKELEDIVQNQSQRLPSPINDSPGLRNDLANSRKNESDALKRETNLKSANRDLKMKVNDLERELHDAHLASLKSRSSSATPPPSHSKELAKLRQQLTDAHEEIKMLESEQREIRRAAKTNSRDNSERLDFKELLQSSSNKAQRLMTQLSDRDAEIQELKAQIKLADKSRDDSHKVSGNNTTHLIEIGELKAQVRRLRTERNELRESSHAQPVRGPELSGMKAQLQRLREERTNANKRAETVEQDLEILQSRYEAMLERLTSGRHGKDDIRDKEIKGLMKELMWIKAKCRREERLRHDLAWSKRYLEQGEAMRVQCNQVDLRILREMGVNIDRKKYEKPLTPKQKFRAGVFTVIAAIRMSNLEERWRDAKMIGEELKAKKSMQARDRK